MNNDANSDSSLANPRPVTSAPDDLLSEGARARKLSGEVEGVKAIIEGTKLVNDVVLVRVLFALWDSGFYEYSLTHASFKVDDAAAELHLDAYILRCLLDYLIGRGIVSSTNDEFGLTERGIRLSNILFSGTINLYVGGWGALVDNIGPLLRKEMTQKDFIALRSPTHTVRGTEQLGAIRTVSAVQQVLAARNLKNVLHVACRTGEFLIGLARSEPSISGIGVDKASERIEIARRKAAKYSVDSRLQFITADVGADSIPLDDESKNRIDVVVALYLLHEVGRHGRAKIIEFLQQVKREFPGRQFLFMETQPYTPPEGKRPPATFTQLDYLLIHRIRGQGLPLPVDQWKSIVAETGLKLLEYKEVYWSGLYLAEM